MIVEVRLAASKLIDGVIQCLDSSYLKKYFGDIYLTVLVKHVLPVRKYWGQIDTRKWQGRVETCEHILIINHNLFFF